MSNHQLITQKEIDSILSKFSTLQINFQNDDIDYNLNLSGNYIWCLKRDFDFQANICTKNNITFSIFNDNQVVYVGKAKRLKKRIKCNHLGKKSNRSTLRRSLGVLMNNILLKNNKFDDPQEQGITNWMKNNLVVYVFPNNDIKQNEKQLICILNPPLNLKENKNIINSDFRNELKKLRKNKI